MWEFIKYCFYCVGIAISGAFGNNPAGLSWKTGAIGIAALLVLSGLAFLVLWGVALAVKHFKSSSQAGKDT